MAYLYGIWKLINVGTSKFEDLNIVVKI